MWPNPNKANGLWAKPGQSRPKSAEIEVKHAWSGDVWGQVWRAFDRCGNAWDVPTLAQEAKNPCLHQESGRRNMSLLLVRCVGKAQGRPEALERVSFRSEFDEN